MFAKRIGVFAFSAVAALSNAHSEERPAEERPAEERPIQYVLISFDGAGPVSQWQRSRQLAAEVDAEFTYFLSCVYLLTSENRSNYIAPGSNGPKSNVGYASSREDVAARLEQIWSARAEGHEIASHGCGHLDGAKWSKADWKHEFAQFTQILLNAWKLNGIDGEPAEWQQFVANEITGFRAPYLSYSENLFKAESKNGFLYDASTVSRDPAAVTKKGGLYRFSLPLIPEGPSARPVIAMDYNLYVRHSGGEERPEQGSVYEQRAYDAFMAAFDKEYAGNRTPLQIGLHFTLMNDGAYWRALEAFARNVCTMEDVRCVGNHRYLEETAPQVLSTPRRIDG